MAKSRTTHVFRAAARDNPDVWFDVERTDKFISVDRLGQPHYKKTTRNMFWGDEYAIPYEHPTRRTREIEIQNPQDETIVIPLHVVDRLVTRRQQGPLYLKSTKIYANDIARNQTRIYSVRRVFHWETETDPRDDGGVEYARVDGSIDRSQYIDVAVIEKLVTRSGKGPGFKQKTYVYNTAPIKEFSEPTPENEINLERVVFLDPWQNIINVQFGHPFVAFGYAANEVAYSPDGKNWTRSNYTGPPLMHGAWCKGLFLGSHSYGTGPNAWASILATSRGGNTWQTVAHPLGGHIVRRILANTDVFVVWSSTAPYHEYHWITVGTVVNGALVWTAGPFPTPIGHDHTLESPVPAFEDVRGFGVANNGFYCVGFISTPETYSRPVGYDFVEDEPIYDHGETFRSALGTSAFSADGINWTVGGQTNSDHDETVPSDGIWVESMTPPYETVFVPTIPQGMSGKTTSPGGALIIKGRDAPLMVAFNLASCEVSADGFSWAKGPDVPVGGVESQNMLISAQNFGGSFGNGDFFLPAGIGGYARAYTTPTPDALSPPPLPIPEPVMFSPAVYGNNIWVLANATIYTSPDARTWTAAPTQPGFANYGNIIY